ncbi:transferase family-domain-containing protein [Camillea tinctor]|nr:transferase family-domain-containing protein [Camillea tinctor]
MATISPASYQISPLEKLMPRVYVRQIYCFPSPNPSAIEVLMQGLAGAVSDIPYLLSGIITTGPGQMDISLSAPYQSPSDLFSCLDLSSSLDYASLKASHFPPTAFTIPGLFPREVDRPYPNPAPVFRARACPIRGGLLLCVAVHHSTTDITGFGALLRIWASHCRTRSSRAAGFDPSWIDRRLLLQPSSNDNAAPPPFPPFLHALDAEGMSKFSSRADPPVRLEDYRTGIFFFAQAGLDALKRAASEHLLSSSPPPCPWVSTGDILAALLWSAMFSAEGNNNNDDDNGSSTLSFPVNFRSRVPLNPSYLGAAFAMTAAHAPAADLRAILAGPSPTASLAAVAAAHRRSVTAVDAPRVRAHLAYLGAGKDAPVVLGTGHFGMSVVSWAGQGAREVDWGAAVGGRCEAVRVSAMAYRRYPIVLPRVPGREGGLEVIVCFEEGYMERFARSWGVREYAVVRCMG